MKSARRAHPEAAEAVAKRVSSLDVMKRDVSKDGRRCTERSYLEFHHANEPYALGGEATVENISFRCRAHNVYESELIFGPYEPCRVRETPAAYVRADYWSRDQ